MVILSKHAEGPKSHEPGKAKKPLEEGIAGTGLPIWVKTGGHTDLRQLFLLINDVLNEKGFICEGDVQTEPLESMRLIDFFEVRSREGRHCELVGMISLYGNGKPELLRLSPDYPGASQALIGALGEAAERLVLSKEMPADFEMSVHESLRPR